MSQPGSSHQRYEFVRLYKARQALPPTPENAERVNAEIMAAAATRPAGADGPGLPEAVVDRARDPGNLLHGFFEWDDSEAAATWRLEQARDLIRGIKIVTVTITRNDKEVSHSPVPVWASVKVGSEPRGYKEVMVLTATEDGRQALLNEALTQLARFRTRYQALVELADVMRAIDQALAQLDEEGGSEEP